MSIYSRNILKLKIKRRKIKRYYYQNDYIFEYFNYRNGKRKRRKGVNYENIINNKFYYINIQHIPPGFSESPGKFRDSGNLDWSKFPRKMNRLFYKKETNRLIKEYFYEKYN